MFYLLGLLGGILLIGLHSIYYLFAVPKIEKGWNGKGYLALGAIVWFIVIVEFVYEPYCNYCVRKILNSGDGNILLRFRWFLFYFLAGVQIYWVTKFYRKQKEYQKLNPVERPIKRPWF